MNNELFLAKKQMERDHLSCAIRKDGAVPAYNIGCGVKNCLHSVSPRMWIV